MNIINIGALNPQALVLWVESNGLNLLTVDNVEILVKDPYGNNRIWNPDSTEKQIRKLIVRRYYQVGDINLQGRFEIKCKLYLTQGGPIETDIGVLQAR